MKLNKILWQVKEAPSQIIPTGIMALDRELGGLHIGHVCTVAGRPAMGTTAFVVSLIRNIGIRDKVPTAFLSLECNELDVVRRLWAAEFGWRRTPRPQYPFVVETSTSFSHIPSILESKMNQEQLNAISMLHSIGFSDPVQEAAEYRRLLNEAPVWVEHDDFLTMDEIICRMERLKKENNVKVIAIDGLDWVYASTVYIERERAMQNLVAAAERLRVAVLLTSGLNRDVENRVAHWPMLSDLRGGYQTEKFTSAVMLLYRPEYYGIEEDEMGDTAGMVDIIIAKSVFGNTGKVRLCFEERARFKDIECAVPLTESKIDTDVVDDNPFPFF